MAHGETNIKTKDRQCTQNVTLRRVRSPLLLWKGSKYYTFSSVYVSARALVWVPGRMGVCMRVALLIHHATRMRHTVS